MRSFFERMGYHCEMADVIHVGKRSHGDNDISEIPELHVTIGGVKHQAKEMMEAYVKTSILHPAIPMNPVVEQAANQLKIN